jgi:WD40 repeat protein
LPETKRPLKVFLCHASADKPKVRELYRYLRRRGIKPWFDEVDLVAGQDWQVEIPEAIRISDAIIICLTRNSLDKEGYIQKEIRFALDRALEMPPGRIFLIPARFEECEVPSFLGNYQWVDLFDKAGYRRMVRALKFRASQLNRDSVEVPRKDLDEEMGLLENVGNKPSETDEDETVAEEKVELDNFERENVEITSLTKVGGQAKQVPVSKSSFSPSIRPSRLPFSQTAPFLKIGGVITIVLSLFLMSRWAIQAFLSPAPTASVTPSRTDTFLPPKSPTSTPILIATFAAHSTNWEGTPVSWSGEPISAEKFRPVKEVARVSVGREGHPSSQIFFSQNEELIIYGLGDVVYVRQANDGNNFRTFTLQGTVFCLSLSADGNILAAINRGKDPPRTGNTLNISRINDGTLLQRRFWPVAYRCPAISPDGAILASPDATGISIRQTSDFSAVTSLAMPDVYHRTDDFYSWESFGAEDPAPAFSQDGTLLAATGSEDIYIWDVKDWDLKMTLPNASGLFTLSPDNNLIASIQERKISVWNINERRLIQTLEYTSSNRQPSLPLFFLNGGEILVSGLNSDPTDSTDQASVALWRISDGHLLQEIKSSYKFLGGAVSADNSTLILLSAGPPAYFSQERILVSFFAVAP